MSDLLYKDITYFVYFLKFPSNPFEDLYDKDQPV